jgi:hypothetical protein
MRLNADSPGLGEAVVRLRLAARSRGDRRRYRLAHADDILDIDQDPRSVLASIAIVEERSDTIGGPQRDIDDAAVDRQFLVTHSFE